MIHSLLVEARDTPGCAVAPEQESTSILAGPIARHITDTLATPDPESRLQRWAREMMFEEVVVGSGSR
jgi:hypothetical protein